jgi:hypothetical protein
MDTLLGACTLYTLYRTLSMKTFEGYQSIENSFYEHLSLFMHVICTIYCILETFNDACTACTTYICIYVHVHVHIYIRGLFLRTPLMMHVLHVQHILGN